MNSKFRYTVKDLHGVLALKLQGARVLVRTLDRLCCFDHATGELFWSLELKGDHAFGYKDIRLSAGDTFFLARHLRGQPNEIISEARSTDSGALLWSVPIGWELSANYGGLQRLPGYFIAGEAKANEVRLRLFAIESGKTVATLTTQNVPPAGSLPYSRQTAISTGQGVYYCGGKTGVSVIRPSVERFTLAPFFDGVAVQLFAWDDKPGAVIYNEGELIAQAFDHSGQVQKEWPLADNPAAIAYDSKFGLITVAEEGDAFTVFPIGGGKAVWHKSGPEWMITNVIPTPVGLVAGMDAQAGSFIRGFAWTDGKELSLPQAWQAAKHSPVFSRAATCWIDLPDGLTAFTLDT